MLGVGAQFEGAVRASACASRACTAFVADAIAKGPGSRTKLGAALIRRMREGPFYRDSMEDALPQRSSPREEPLGDLSERSTNELRAWSKRRGLPSRGSRRATVADLYQAKFCPPAEAGHHRR